MKATAPKTKSKLETEWESAMISVLKRAVKPESDKQATTPSKSRLAQKAKESSEQSEEHWLLVLPNAKPLQSTESEGKFRAKRETLTGHVTRAEKQGQAQMAKESSEQSEEHWLLALPNAKPLPSRKAKESSEQSSEHWLATLSMIAPVFRQKNEIK